MLGQQPVPRFGLDERFFDADLVGDVSVCGDDRVDSARLIPYEAIRNLGPAPPTVNAHNFYASTATVVMRFCRARDRVDGSAAVGRSDEQEVGADHLRGLPAKDLLERWRCPDADRLVVVMQDDVGRVVEQQLTFRFDQSRGQALRRRFPSRDPIVRFEARLDREIDVYLEIAARSVATGEAIIRDSRAVGLLRRSVETADLDLLAGRTGPTWVVYAGVDLVIG